MAGFISDATREQIRSANDIIDIIGAAIPLKRSGANFMALCPFHREKTPSFYVNPRKQVFHCYGCHKGGDVFTWVKEYEGLDFPGALKRLAERARIPLEFEKDPQFQQKQFLKDKLLDVHEQLTQRWHQALLADAGGERARQYLKERGVSEEAVKLFRLGYAPEAWDDTTNWARSKGFDLAMVEQAGLLIRKEETGNYYARFRGRLMFPICDEQGRVIGFSGRVLPGDDDERKYVNSPETPLFTKSRVMFGLDKSKRSLLDKQFAIVCEGQLDLIACFMAGVQNVIAPQGTALTNEHSRILKRYVNEVVLCFDSDNAGQRATVRVLDDLLGSGLAIRVATVPAPHDPDSYIKNFGVKAFEEVISKAEGFFDYYLGRLCANNDLGTDRGQQTVIKAMAEGVAKTKDQTLFDKYAQRTAARIGINPTSALQVFKRALGAPQRAYPQEEEEEAEEDNSWRPGPAEGWLLRLVLAQDDLLDWARQNLDISWIVNPLVRTIVAHRLTWDEDGNPVQPAAILGEVEDVRAQSLITEALAEEKPLPKPEQQMADLTTRVRNQYLDRRMAAIMQRLADPTLNGEEMTKLLQEQKELRAAKAKPIPAQNGAV